MDWWPRPTHRSSLLEGYRAWRAGETWQCRTAPCSSPLSLLLPYSHQCQQCSLSWWQPRQAHEHFQKPPTGAEPPECLLATYHFEVRKSNRRALGAGTQSLLSVSALLISFSPFEGYSLSIPGTQSPSDSITMCAVDNVTTFQSCHHCKLLLINGMQNHSSG